MLPIAAAPEATAKAWGLSHPASGAERGPRRVGFREYSYPL